MEESLLLVEESHAGKRLDVWLASVYPDFSRTYFQDLLEEGLILVNGELQRKRYLVQAGDEVEVELRMRELPRLLAQDLPLSVLYEDEHILVINKAPGMVVHPAPGNPTGTLANALAHRYGLTPTEPALMALAPAGFAYQLGSADLVHKRFAYAEREPLTDASLQVDLRPGIVHRLDKDTSGVLITAKTQRVHAKLVEQFALRKAQKTYLAIACKNPPPEKVELAIERDPCHRQRMLASGKGKSALTLFKLLASSEGGWPLHLLEVGLLTGRTHQIRVHLKAHQSPLLGDATYGWNEWNEHYATPRQMLHAWKLALAHPITGAWMQWVAPVAEDMARFLSMIPGLSGPGEWSGSTIQDA